MAKTKKPEAATSKVVAMKAKSAETKKKVFDPYNPSHVKELPLIQMRVGMISNLIHAATNSNKDVTGIPEPVVEVLRPEEGDTSIVNVEISVMLGAAKANYHLAKFKKPMLSEEDIKDVKIVEAALVWAIDSILSSFTSLGMMNSLSIVHREWKSKEGKIIKAFPR